MANAVNRAAANRIMNVSVASPSQNRPCCDSFHVLSNYSRRMVRVLW